MTTQIQYLPDCATTAKLQATVMKDLYTIGEVASLLGISTQALRFYSNMGLIHPKHIDRQTGYRYYAYNQFHKIDRIKYLQKLGMSLVSISNALHNNQVSDLLEELKKHRLKKHTELMELSTTIEVLDWYIGYYNYLENDKFLHIPFKRFFKSRYLLAVPMRPGESLVGPGGYRLAELKNKPEFKNLIFLRQHGYILNFQALLEHRIEPEYYFVYLKEPATYESSSILTLPAGEYLCFQGHLLASDWSPDLAIDLMKNINPSCLVVADEYENNLNEFTHDIYEIQTLITEKT